MLTIFAKRNHQLIFNKKPVIIYALDIIKDTVLLRAKPEPFLMEENLKLNNIDGNILNNPAYISIWFEDLNLSNGYKAIYSFCN